MSIRAPSGGLNFTTTILTTKLLNILTALNIPHNQHLALEARYIIHIQTPQLVYITFTFANFWTYIPYMDRRGCIHM